MTKMVEPIFKEVLPIPEVKIDEAAQAAWTILAEWFDYRTFRDDLDYLHKDCRIPMVKIADEVGVNRLMLYHWRRGDWAPRNPYPMVVVRIWATKMKEARAEQEALVGKPSYSVH